MNKANNFFQSSSEDWHSPKNEVKMIYTNEIWRNFHNAVIIIIIFVTFLSNDLSAIYHSKIVCAVFLLL